MRVHVNARHMRGLRGPPPCHTYTYMYYYTEVIFTFGYTALYVHKDARNGGHKAKRVRYAIK